MACGIDDTKPSLRGEYDHDIEECRRVIAALRIRLRDREEKLEAVKRWRDVSAARTDAAALLDRILKGDK